MPYSMYTHCPDSYSCQLFNRKQGIHDHSVISGTFVLHNFLYAQDFSTDSPSDYIYSLETTYYFHLPNTRYWPFFRP
jgi:hypothetical protein